MRSIDDIILELKQHPDYMTSEIYTWSEFVSQADEIDDVSDLSKDLKIEICDYIDNSIADSDINHFPILIRNEDTGELEIEYDQF